MKRIWFDGSFGTNPGDATALVFACKHPDLKVVGVSISGTQQQRRLEEAYAVLDYVGENDAKVFLGADVERRHIDATRPDHTIVLGPLTNIARLVLEETQLGRLHVHGGAFRVVDYRGEKVTVTNNISDDLDSARVVLTQYVNTCLSSFEASSALILDEQTRRKIESIHQFLKNRYEGFDAYLESKYADQYREHIYCGLLPVCDILNTATITREVIEFYIQPDGSFRRAYVLAHRPPLIAEVTSNPNGVPVPLVKHEVIRSVESPKVFIELLAVL